MSLSAKPPREPSYIMRRYFGMLTLIAIVLTAIGVLVSLAAGIYPIRNGSFTLVPRKPYVHASNPIELVERGKPPTSSRDHQLPATPAVRAIVVNLTNITLLAGGKTIRVIRRETTLLDLAQLKKILNDKRWIDEPAPGKVDLKAALIINHVIFTVGSPLSEVRLANTPGVFIGANSGVLNFKDVIVTSVPVNNSEGSDYRPFVMAIGGATLNAANTHFIGLGWDWNASYGVSWVEGANGEANGCTFQDNFIGAYAIHTANIVFEHNTFKGNSQFGLNLNNSSNMSVDHVTAEDNKSHGIIFGDHAHNNVIANSTSRNNGENGIMMDKASAENWVTDNTVSNNTGDGLVTVASPRNVFSGNVVHNNRVGLQIDITDGPTTTLTGNQINSNGLISEGTKIPSSNTATGNGGQWNWVVVRQTWIVIGKVWLSFAVIFVLTTLLRRWRRCRHPLPPKSS